MILTKDYLIEGILLKKGDKILIENNKYKINGKGQHFILYDICSDNTIQWLDWYGDTGIISLRKCLSDLKIFVLQNQLVKINGKIIKDVNDVPYVFSSAEVQFINKKCDYNIYK